MSSPTVLVVDDDRDLADLYATWLAERYVVHTAYGGQEALDAVDELGNDLDAILLDRRMPDISGDLALVLLRDRGYDCPVAMVSAVDPAGDIVALGFDDYLVKPATQDDLFGLVDSLVSIDSLDSLARELSTLRVKHSVLSMESSSVTADAELDALEEAIESLERALATQSSRAAAD